MADVVGAHVGQERPQAVDDAEQVDPDDPLEVAQRQLCDREAAAADSGVVAQQMDVAEHLERLGGERVHIGFEARVGRDGEHIDTRSRDLRCGLLQHGAFDVGEHESHAFRREAICQGAPDARGGPGDDRDLSLEVVHDQVRSRYAE